MKNIIHYSAQYTVSSIEEPGRMNNSYTQKDCLERGR